MKIYKLLINKKGDMPSWLVTTISALAILVFVLLVIIGVKKGIYSNILAIFKRW